MGDKRDRLTHSPYPILEMLAHLNKLQKLEDALQETGETEETGLGIQGERGTQG